MQKSYAPMSHSPFPLVPPPLLGSAPAMAGYPSVVVPSAMAAVNSSMPPALVKARIVRRLDLVMAILRSVHGGTRPHPPRYGANDPRLSKCWRDVWKSLECRCESAA